MEIKLVKPLHKQSVKVDSRILGGLINAVYQEVDSVSDYKELAGLINNRFNVEVTEDDIVRFYTPYLCLKEAELQYEKYGFTNNLEL